MALSGWQLVMQQGPRVGQAFDLNKPVVTIGREANTDIVIEDPQVSRHHTRLTLQGAGYVVEDLGSTNGTFVNGQRVTGVRPIVGGDMLGLGDTVLLRVMGAAGAGETMVAHPQPQMAAPPYGGPSTAPGFAPPPPPPPPPVARQGSRTWMWACGCLVLLCICLIAAIAILSTRPEFINWFNSLLDTLGVQGLRFQP